MVTPKLVSRDGRQYGGVSVGAGGTAGVGGTAPGIGGDSAFGTCARALGGGEGIRRRMPTIPAKTHPCPVAIT